MSNSSSEDQDEGAEELRQRPAHHPSAPSHEAFDISTTVDPSYVISLIRKLLPADAKDGEHATGTGSIGRELRTGVTKEESENGGEAEAMESSENHDKLDLQEPTNDYQNEGGSTERTWEECGCILWDLAASEDHAQFMVQNLILEVLLATLVASQSSRITEISLGIIGNLACHEISRKSITSVDGLVGSIVEKLFLDDVPCLCEACRVYSVLDLILITIEELSTMDNYSEEISENKELLELVKELVKLPDKFEGLFDVFPFASKETEAQNAIWSIISRILTVVQEREMTPSTLNFLVSILASKLDLIEDELLAHPLDHVENSTRDTSGAKVDTRLIAMKRVFEILTWWKSSDDSISSAEGCCINDEDVDKLLDHCCQASS